MTSEQPELPYAGTSGWSGSETSEARAIEADESGVTQRRQRETLVALGHVGSAGLTYKELGDMMGWHHGQSSSSLSVLHKVDRISRLAEKRNRCKVYVLTDFVNERDTEPPGRNKAANGLLADAIRVLREHGECTFHDYPEPDCRTCRGVVIVNEYDRRRE